MWCVARFLGCFFFFLSLAVVVPVALAVPKSDGLIKDAEAYWIIDASDQTCLTELGTFGRSLEDIFFFSLSLFHWLLL